ncbi:berberine bridge enzyme-like 21 [Rutidosis leptorrhynchoides]|uniref:berberine bridge enzyme-like 21 n=1 Tax=Rutidosis leptorrhynchoides TaxID=125765 RepID=UPI003A99859A
MKFSYSLLQLLLLPFIFQSFTTAVDDSIYETFLQCMSTQNSFNQVSSIIYNPNNSSYTSTLQAYIRNQRFNTSTTPKPLIIVTPLNESHVQSTIICTKNVGINLRIRSGGHDFEGLSYVSYVNFILLDMSNIRSIEVNIEEETATVQVGAIVGELYYRIWEKSKVHAFPAGVCPTVGIGGHISGGGYGNLIRKYGLTIDKVIDAKIVDVNGQILDRKLMGEDLFWSIRGGGGASFGVVLSYKLKLVRVPKIVTVFRVFRTLEDNLTDVFNKWQYVADKIDRDLFIRLNVGANVVNNTISAKFIAIFLGDGDRLVSVMNEKFPELGIKKTDCKEMSWIESVLFWTNADNAPVEFLLQRNGSVPSYAKRKSDYLQSPIPREGIELLWQKIMELSVVGLSFNPYGGRMSEIQDRATPFPHRAGNICKIEYSVNWNDNGTKVSDYSIGQIQLLHDFLTRFVSKNPRGAFFNYRDLDIGTSKVGNNSYADGKVYGEQYFKRNFYRLVKVKSMVDPSNFFTNEQSIPSLNR